MKTKITSALHLVRAFCSVGAQERGVFLSAFVVNQLRPLSCHSCPSRRSFSLSSRMDEQCDGLDPTQLSLLKEECIAVDHEDNILASITKEDAHLMGPQGALPPLHRAFSVFLFNSKNELLMQQRSQFKITFPGIHSSNHLHSHHIFCEKLNL